MITRELIEQYFRGMLPNALGSEEQQVYAYIRQLEAEVKEARLTISGKTFSDAEIKEAELRGAEKMLRFLTDKGSLFYDDNLDENILKQFQAREKGGDKL